MELFHPIISLVICFFLSFGWATMVLIQREKSHGWLHHLHPTTPRGDDAGVRSTASNPGSPTRPGAPAGRHGPLNFPGFTTFQNQKKRKKMVIFQFTVQLPEGKNWILMLIDWLNMLFLLCWTCGFYHQNVVDLPTKMVVQTKRGIDGQIVSKHLVLMIHILWR